MAIRNFRSGNFSTDTPSDIIALWADCSNATYSTLRKVSVGGAYPASSSSGLGYIVPVGKTFWITRFVGISNGGGANYTSFALLHGTTDIGFNTGTAPASAVAVVGIAAAFRSPLHCTYPGAGAGGSPAALSEGGIGFMIPIPASRYITVSTVGDSGSTVYMEGFEA